jgi:hypothetical protein
MSQHFAFHRKTSASHLLHRPGKAVTGWRLPCLSRRRSARGNTLGEQMRITGLASLVMSIERCSKHRQGTRPFNMSR